MKLVGSTITLAPFDDSDLDLFVELTMSSAMMTHVDTPHTYEQAKAKFDARAIVWSLDSEDWLSFSITENASGEKLGNIALKITESDAKIAEVGYMIKPEAQGKGIASQALGLVIPYAFDTLTINKIIALCTTDNTGSYKVLEKLGFVREGCLRQNAVINNQYVDDYTYGLCRSDLEQK